MSEFIHARRTPEGLRYRLWQTITDSYTSEPLTLDELRAYLLDSYSPRDVREGRAEREIAERLARADARGTSAIRSDEAVPLDAPWETERCWSCGGFHHGYRPRGDGACRDCGEPESARDHGPECDPF